MIEVDTYPSAGTIEGSASGDATPALSEVSVIEILTTLAMRKGFIAKVSGSALLAGVAISLLLPVRYTATTRIMTPQPTPSANLILANQLNKSGLDSLSSLGGAAGLGFKNPNVIYIALLSSRSIADDILQHFGLVSEYHSKNMTSARKALAANTRIVSESSGLIAISVTDSDRNRAAEISNAYTQGLRTLTKTLAVTEASQRRIYYEDQLKHAKDELVKAEFALQQVQRKKGVVLPEAQAKAVIEGLASLQAQVAAKEVELQALRSYSTERNPNVQIVESELDSLRAQARLKEQTGPSGSSSVLGLQDVAGGGLEFLDAEHELQYRQILFDMLLKQYDAARLDESRDAAVMQVVEPAIPPDLKSSPRRAAIVLLLTALAFLSACLYALTEAFVAANPAIARALGRFRAVLLNGNKKEKSLLSAQ